MYTDKPLYPSVANSQTGRTNIERFLGPDAPTVREILEEFQNNSVMGPPFIGDPVQVVDQAQAVLEATGADGFLVQPEYTGTFGAFFELVVPELRRRGLMADPTPGDTLRQRLGAEGPHLVDSLPGSAYRGGAAHASV